MSHKTRKQIDRRDELAASRKNNKILKTLFSDNKYNLKRRITT